MPPMGHSQHFFVRVAAACFLLLALALPLLTQVFFSARFFYEREVIAREHCINKNRPELGCYGLCYLKRELAQLSLHGQTAPAERPPLSQSFVYLEIPPALLPGSCLTNPVFSSEPRSFFPNRIYSATSGFPHQPFTPPDLQTSLMV